MRGEVIDDLVVDVSMVEVFGVVFVFVFCFEDDVFICELSRFWVGGSKV